ncbi:xylulokinase [Pectobacterium odoriferum]|uniref:xylulokinase n=1 Tax=Pectobacterium odoriferum TaxID=78398 RepID=UPI0013740D5D|nr:xylulokinase [Pectobacterium odoriferum]QHP81541.1 xylulokinase [Pectobacterium odoriferum]GKW05002.1 xylulokinase [Pectobacterium carotovorum subsp. carotovorum]GKX44707.1 xylulokinase [Pectobacterium carotovorum subsp. carotovorum]GLX58555.1 xylulokinase [Pectobacterium carotovorum subsp. carotovorum]
MYLGIDLGTSEVKALIIDENNEPVATHSAPLSIQRPHPHWSEQAPQAWWEATEYLMTTLREKCGQHWQAIKAIGLSGQMHGAVMLDADGDVIRPAILWNDTRSAQECKELEEIAPELHQVAGNLAMPGFTAPKLMWVRRHEPDNFKRVSTVLLPKDYLRYRMTGKKISDMSDSAGTLWLDVAKRDWSDALLEKCGLSRRHMPELVEGCDVSATLAPQIAERWGLTASVIVAGGGGDNAVSAIGVGAVSPGDAFISLGTSGVLFVVTDAYRPAPQSAVHAFCHVLPNLWHQMSVMLSAASCLQWFCRLTGTTEVALLEEIEQLSDDEKASAPLFLPYLSGERTPHNDPDVRGMFWGMTHSSLRAQLGYAVLEGVSFGIADGLRVLKESGTQIEQCSLVGGGARSPFWAQLLADILNMPVVTHKGGETGGALGAARLACLAAGKPLHTVCDKPEVYKIWHAEPARHQTLAQRYQQFNALYLNDLNYRHS